MTTVITTAATETPAATPGVTAIARRLDTSDTQQLAHRLTPVFAAWLDALGAADPTRMSDEDIRLMAAAANRIGVRDALIVTALNAEEAGTAEHAAAVATEPHTPRTRHMGRTHTPKRIRLQNTHHQPREIRDRRHPARQSHRPHTRRHGHD